MRHFLLPPVFVDPERTQLAEALYLILRVLMPSICLAGGVLALALPQSGGRWLLMVVATELMALVAWALTQHGRPRLASVVLVCLLWAMVTAFAATAGGIRAQATPFYGVIVFLAGLLLGRRWGFAVGVGCALTGLALVLAEGAGWLPARLVTPTSFSLWAVLVLVMVAIVAIQFLAASTVQTALEQARRDLAERQRSTDALQQAQHLMQTLMDNLPDGIYFKDLDSRFIRINQAQTRVLGVDTLEQAIGKTDADFFAPEHAHIAFQNERDIIRTGRPLVNHEERLTWPGRPTQWVMATKMPLRDRDGNIVGTFGISRNIDERKRAQEALAASEERLRLAMDVANDFLWDWNLATGEAYFSPNYYTRLGYAPGELPASDASFETLLHPADIPVVRQAWADYRAGQRDGYERDFRALTKEGEVRWMHSRAKIVTWDAEGRPVRLVGNISDITARKQAEDALRESEATLRAMIDALPDPCLLLDVHGTIQTVNRSVADLLGVGRDALVGANVVEALGPMATAGRWARMEQVLHTRESVRFEDERDGRSFLNSIYPIFDAAGEISRIAIFALDITERKEAESARLAALVDKEEALAQLAATLKAVPDLLFEVDGAGRICSYNAPQHELLYAPPEEFLGKAVSEVLPESAAQVITGALVEAAQDGQHRGATYVLDLPDGPHWFELSIAVKGELGAPEAHFVLTARDITTRKRAESQRAEALARMEEALLQRASALAQKEIALEALRESEERFRRIFEEGPLGMVLSAEDGRLVRTNGAFCRLMGYSEPELAALTFYDITHPDHVAQDTAGVLQVWSGERPVYHTEKRYVRKDGAIVWATTTVSAVRDKDGRAAHLIDMIEDITDHKQLEEQYLQAQKMETVGRLAGGIAHDFNNLLTAVGGYAELIRESVATDPELCRDVDEIIKATDRAAGLTRQLLTFSRRQVIQPHVVDLNHLMLETSRMLRALIGTNVELVTLPGRDLWPVTADPGQIEQVLVNLAVNAHDAMPQGGKLIIQAANAILDAAFVQQHIGVQAGDYVLLTVSDTGVGMTDEVKAHLFEPFFTTKGPGKGTGLGLATVYGIVRQHQGSIWVDSEPGRGATFRIYLPRTAVVEAGAPPPTARARLPRGTETILVVEDESLVRAFTVQSLTRLGYTVLQAGDGAEALRVFEAHAGPIPLVVTDVVMPQMGGWELAERLAAEHPAVKVLLVSGYTAESAATQQGLLAEGAAFLQKPFTPAALANKVHELLHG